MTGSQDGESLSEENISLAGWCVLPFESSPSIPLHGHHTLFLDPIAPLAAQGRGDAAYWMVPVASGHTISLYPVVAPVLIAPLYLPAVGYLQLRGWTDARLDHMAKVMEKLSASLVAALSASLLYLLLRRRAAAPIAGEDLDEGFRTAATRLRAHQQGSGYWLTAYTSAAASRSRARR